MQVLTSTLSLEMAHGAITASLGLPLITLDSPSLGSIFTVWFDPPNGNSGTIGKNRLPSCATMTLAFAPIESEVAFVNPNLVHHESLEWGSNCIPLGTCHRSSDVCAEWKKHFSQIASCPNAKFDTVFAAAISDQFRAHCADQATSEFDAPFTESEFVWALGQFSDSATGGDGLPYSVFQANLDWWRRIMLDFFNLVFAWNAVPPAWKSSEVVPVLKYGDRTNPDNHRPISLASRAFKMYEHLIHGRIAPHILPRLDEAQSGFRWGADALVCSLVDTLRLRHETHTVCGFIDIRKAFDTAWVDATLVRLAQIGVNDGMWHTITNFLVGTISQVRIGDAHSHPWMDTGIAQGRVLSPLLFNLRKQLGRRHSPLLPRCPPRANIRCQVCVPDPRRRRGHLGRIC